MKTLYLIRHAKSSWKDRSLDDFDRPLNKRGNRDAPLMGELLQERSPVPELILSSPALRAITTAHIIADAIGYPRGKILTDEAIYLASVDTLLEIIRNIHDRYSSVFMFGHNPGFTDLGNELTNSQIDNLPTAGLFHVEFDLSSWQDVAPGRGRLAAFEFPKKHL